MFGQRFNSNFTFLILTLVFAFAGFRPNLVLESRLWAGPLDNDPFEKSKDILNDLLRLKLDDGRLMLDRDHWQNVMDKTAGNELTLQLIEQDKNPMAGGRFHPLGVDNASGPLAIFGLLNRNIHGRDRRGSGGESSSSGWGFASANFRSQSVDGRIETRGDRFTFSMSESSSQHRMLQFVEDVNHYLQITVSDEELDRLLVIRQSQDRFVVVFVSERENLSASAKTYAEMLRENRQLINETVLPILHEMGVSKPLDAESVSVVNAVFAKIKVLTSPVESESSKLIDQLASDKFAEREEGLEALKERFEDHQSAIELALQGGTLLPEVRVRLERLVNDHKSLYRDEYQIIETFGLLDSVPYLIQLFQFADENQTRSLGQYLGTLTEQDFGSDSEAWRAWLAKQPDFGPAIDD